MKEQTAPKEHVLARHEKRLPVLDVMNVDELKRVARFWFGTTASNKMRKAECITALTQVFKDRAKLEAGLGSLSEKERQVLAVFGRYGGTLSGAVLLGELLARGVIEKEDPSRPSAPWETSSWCSVPPREACTAAATPITPFRATAVPTRT
jgi:hypothetical protein